LFSLTSTSAAEAEQQNFSSNPLPSKPVVEAGRNLFSIKSNPPLPTRTASGQSSSAASFPSILAHCADPCLFLSITSSRGHREVRDCLHQKATKSRSKSLVIITHHQTRSGSTAAALLLFPDDDDNDFLQFFFFVFFLFPW
jgi:hypothetical protein